MNEPCAHTARDEIILAMESAGWMNNHETKKVLLFQKDGTSIYFNGQDHSHIDLVFHPVIVGSNFREFQSLENAPSDRFMSNYRELPQKPSPGQPLNYFGVGCKFDGIEEALSFVKNLNIPVIV
ncbi:hypothetical protein [Hyphomonas oceanitis]|uniref:Uncharacterized protein n=1 Tax=Hyphomonas oceanitis SCH89 TaxID=1280953 RepID=A0A059GBF6_9PROT|nr:hypothetical protein [Hyphomonas oceanitis]KDA04156.1 hypothetical protein HOC_02431 [Hyphomonas oceanitis SCH89]